MKKIAFYFSILLLGIFSVKAQVQIGTGTVTTDTHAPFIPLFDYTYSQTIYLSSEINSSGNITSIEWFYTGTSNLTNSQDLVVYLGTTSKNEFTSISDFIPTTNLTKVYDGKFFTNGTAGWKKITLPTPFSYNGTDNLVVAVDENTPESDLAANGFYNTTVDKKRSLTNWGDSFNWDPANPGTMCCEIVNGWSTNIPNIKLGGLQQTCVIPSYISFSNVKTTTATISWQTTAVPAGGADLYYSTSNTLPTASTTPKKHMVSGITTTNLAGLTPETTYYVWLRNVCSTTDKSTWSGIKSFKTDCNGVTDFVENFDSVTTPELPSCWRKILKGPGLATEATIASYGNSIPESSPNIVELYNGISTASANIILVSPNLSNLAAGTHHLVFYARGRDCVLQIGTMDKNDETGVFTTISSISPNQIAMTKYDIDFKGYRGTDHYIALRLDMSATIIDNPPHHFVDVDSFKWEVDASCPDIGVATIEALSTTTTSATIGWGAVTANAYQVAVGTSSVTDPNTLTPLEPSSSLSQTVNGLSEGTTYKYWVRSVCSSENGNWLGPKTFTTACAQIASFKETFETTTDSNLPTCWGKIIRGATIPDYAMIETNVSQSNTSVMMNVGSNSNSDDVILVSPNLSTLKLGTYRLKFYANRNHEISSLQVGTLSTNTNAAVFNNIQNISLTEDLQQFIVEFNNYTGNDTFIGIRMNNFNSSSFVTVDDVVLELSPLCPDVIGIKTTVLNPENATINWTEGGGETSWQVAVGNSTVTDPNTLTPIKVDVNPTKEILGLTPDTNYNVWVRSYCSATELGYWIGPISFTTPCAPVASLNENFETAIGKELPHCWGKIIRGYAETNYPPTIESWQNALMPEDTTAISMSNLGSGISTDIILVSPYVSNLASGTYRLRFKSKGDVSIQLGTLNSSLNTAVFTPIQTIKSTTNPTEYAVDFSSAYNTMDKYIGIRLNATEQYKNVLIDDVIWEPIPACPDVVQLKTTNTTMDSATITWDANWASKWQIAYSDTNVTDPNTLVFSTVDSVVQYLADLSAGTTYKLWVRSVCDFNSSYGSWKTLLFTTQCTSTTIPYLLDFENVILPNLPTCTSSINMAKSPTNWYTSKKPGYGFESNTLTYDSDLYTDANAWFFTRGLELMAGNTYTVSFKYGGASEDMFYYVNSLKVMYGSSANPGDMSNTVIDFPSFALIAPVPVNATITPTQTGIYYFGFNVYSPNNSNFMYIDDIVIDQTLSNNQFDKSQLSYYPNPVKDILSISYADEIKSVDIYNMLGQKILSQNVNATNALVNVSSLASGTYLLKFTNDNESKMIKIIKE